MQMKLFKAIANNQSGSVLDLCSGSGSATVAALACGFNAIAVESDNRQTSFMTKGTLLHYQLFFTYEINCF